MFDRIMYKAVLKLYTKYQVPVCLKLINCCVVFEGSCSIDFCKRLYFKLIYQAPGTGMFKIYQFYYSFPLVSHNSFLLFNFIKSSFQVWLESTITTGSTVNSSTDRVVTIKAFNVFERLSAKE